MMFQAIRSKKLTNTIIHQIRSAILEGKISPGEKLPSEKELTEQFQASKQTIRESLRVLEHMGMLDIRKGSGGGAFVVEVEIEFAKRSLANYLYTRDLSIEHLTEVRKTIEPQAARQAALTIRDSDLKRLEEIQSLTGTYLSAEKSRKFSAEAQDFHRVISESTGNPLVILLTDFIESMLKDFKDALKLDEKFCRSVHKAHDKIFQAIQNRDPDTAEQEMYNDIVEVESQLIALNKIKQIDHLIF